MPTFCSSLFVYFQLLLCFCWLSPLLMLDSSFTFPRTVISPTALTRRNHGVLKVVSRAFRALCPKTGTYSNPLLCTVCYDCLWLPCIPFDFCMIPIIPINICVLFVFVVNYTIILAAFFNLVDINFVPLSRCVCNSRMRETGTSQLILRI